MSDFDFTVANHGSVFLFTPRSEAAKAWVKDELTVDGWQWLGNSFGVDHWGLNELVDRICQAGLTVGD